MGDVINSAFDAIGTLPVAETFDNPLLIEEAINELIEGEQAYKLIFKTENTDQDVVAYKEELAPELDDDPQPIAEFGEIPVSDPVDNRTIKYAPLQDYGLGIRVSEKQRRKNRNNDVQREVKSLARTILRFNGQLALQALRDSEIEEFPVDNAWDVEGGDPFLDLNLAIEKIVGATDVNGKQFGYQPDIFWANPVTINIAKRNKTMQDLFIGNMASENPVFKKIAKQALSGDFIQVVPDLSIPVGEAYLAVEGETGIEAQEAAPHQTPFYEEGGQSGIGGPRMTWRSDNVHNKALFVKASKSVIHMTGLVTPVGA